MEEENSFGRQVVSVVEDTPGRRAGGMPHPEV